MKVLNKQWCEVNAQRNYPLSDTASRIDDAGNQLPNEFLADVVLWAPLGIQYKVILSSFSVSPGLVSLTFSADDGNNNFIPLATLSVSNPVSTAKNYQIIPVLEGVVGWVMFGAGVVNGKTAHYRFSTAAQSGLLNRCFVCYASNGVTSLSKPNRTQKLVGAIKLSSGTTDDLIVEYVAKTASNARVVNGSAVDAIVFRLNVDNGGSEVLKKFIGPCDVKPESLTCNKLPIFAINGAIPNCDGQIVIFFNEQVSAPLGSIFTVAGLSGTIEINSDIDQSTVCAASQVVFTDNVSCSDPCIVGSDESPFAGYVRQYGGSL
jgi:hypothetical protein